jgi:hypothetical protein
MCDLENLVNEEAIAHVGLQRHVEKKRQIIDATSLTQQAHKNSYWRHRGIFIPERNASPKGLGVNISRAQGQNFRRVTPQKERVEHGFSRSQANVETVGIFKRAATTLFKILYH